MDLVYYLYFDTISQPTTPPFQMFTLIMSLNAVEVYTSNFAEAIKNNKPTLIKFYAPWCGHCKAIAPKFVQLAELTAAEIPDVVIAEVDCTIAKDVCQQEGVRGYPTLRFYKEGAFVEAYKGQREAAAMKDWITEKLK